MCRGNIASGKAYDLGIFSPDGKELFGGVAINQINQAHKVGNLGYWVRATKQRQNIATRAVKRIVQFGFKELGLTRLEIAVAENNDTSRRVAERIGATFECIASNRLILHGQPLPAALYSLIPVETGSQQ